MAEHRRSHSPLSWPHWPCGLALESSNRVQWHERLTLPSGFIPGAEKDNDGDLTLLREACGVAVQRI